MDILSSRPELCLVVSLGIIAILAILCGIAMILFGGFGSLFSGGAGYVPKDYGRTPDDVRRLQELETLERNHRIYKEDK